MPARDRNEGDSLGIISNLLDKVGSFFDNFVVSGFRPFSGIHLVDSNDKLFDTQSVCQKSVFTSLTILRDTSFKFTDTSGDDD